MTEAIRQALRQQLQYIRRNLKTIRSRYGNDLTYLSRQQYQSLLVVSEVYRQQRKMYDSQVHSVPYRIVSLSQPHVRPIVHGKTAVPVEFGAKISVAKVGRFAYLDHLSWGAYNETPDLPRHCDPS